MQLLSPFLNIREKFAQKRTILHKLSSKILFFRNFSITAPSLPLHYYVVTRDHNLSKYMHLHQYFGRTILDLAPPHLIPALFSQDIHLDNEKSSTSYQFFKHEICKELILWTFQREARVWKVGFIQSIIWGETLAPGGGQLQMNGDFWDIKLQILIAEGG